MEFLTLTRGGLLMLKSLLNDSRAIWQTVSGLEKRITEMEIEIYNLKRQAKKNLTDKGNKNA